MLAEVVRREYGEDAWDALLEAAQLDGVYSSLGSYPDDHLVKLVRAASATLAKPPHAILQWFGRNAIPLLAERYPEFFAPKSTRAFLLTLNDVIHAEVRKLHPTADVPVFDYDTSSPDTLVLGYRSPRKLCALAEGFIEGAAAHYGEPVSLVQLKCMNRGDDRCVLRISWA